MPFVKKHVRSFAKFIVGVLLGFFVLSTLSIIWYGRSFIQPSGLTIGQVKNIVQLGLVKKEQFSNKKITFLILGLDNRDDDLESTLLTDTIIIASLDSANKSLTMIPIPRDLWIDSLKTKVNSLYFYGEKRDNETGISFIEKNIEEITGKTIDYYIIMDYTKLPALIDILGGVNVDIEKSFTDSNYPNPDYISSDSPNSPYVTIAFEQGVQKLDGEQALIYVRSRGSKDKSEGSDISRSKRQIRLVNGMIASLTTRTMLLEPDILGKLYKYWHNEIKTNITDADLVGLGLALKTKYIDINAVQIPTSFDIEKQPILTNPPIKKYGLWVWEPVDPTWEKLREFIKKEL